MNHRRGNTTRRWIHPTYDTRIIYNGRLIHARTFSADDLRRLLDLCRSCGPEIAAATLSEEGPADVPLPLAIYFARQAGIDFELSAAHF